MHTIIGSAHGEQRYAHGHQGEASGRLYTVGLLLTLALGILVAALTDDVQPAVNVRRLGVLTPNAAPSEAQRRQSPFWQAMHELGWVEGQNITVERRDAERRAERLPELAADLVRLGVEVIIAHGTRATQAAMHATTTIPIVMSFSASPVESGLVASLARPGGNVTGIALMSPELAGKQLELFKEAVPGLTHLGVIHDAENGPPPRGALQARAQELGITIHRLDMLGSSSTIEQLFAMITQERPDALWVTNTPFPSFHRQEIADFAAKRGLPTFGEKELVEQGGLMAYEEPARDRWQRVASYVDRILKGAKPAELPIERPMRFQLVLNLKTAKPLGLTIPPSILFQAEEVLQ